MIDVEQCALGSFKEDPLSLFERTEDDLAGVLGQRQDPRRQPLEHHHVLVERRPFRHTEELERVVGPGDRLGEDGARAPQVAQVGHSEPPTADLRLVGRADTAPRGPDLLARLVRPVQQLVVRQHQVGAVGEEEAPFDADPLGRYFVDLGEKLVGVEHHAVPDEAVDPPMQDPRRDLVQDELGRPQVHGVTSVGAPLIANDVVGPLREDVDELSLSFVAPLGADDHQTGVLRIEHGPLPDKTKQAPWGPVWCILWQNLRRSPEDVNSGPGSTPRLRWAASPRPQDRR